MKTATLVPARMINEVLYCERLFYLESVHGEFTDNFYTIDGAARHARVDDARGHVPAPSADAPPYRVRSVDVASERLGMVAKIDFVEGQGGAAMPVEYKRGGAPDVPEGAYLPERAQVCAQALLLREEGYQVDAAAIYFAESRRRVPVVLDDDLIATTKRAAERARALRVSGEIPPPLVDSPKCVGCSLVGICLPDETNLLRGAAAGSIRPLSVARDERAALHVQEQGAKVGLRGDCLVVKRRDGATSDPVRLVHTSNVCVYGNVQVSTQTLRELFQRDIPVSFFTTGGWYCGRASATESKNIALRAAQFRMFADAGACLRLARAIVVAKIKNSRAFLRRNGGDVADCLRQLEAAAVSASRVEALEELLGVEGAAARAYFGGFSSMLKFPSGFSIEGRNRRPPRDPVNAMLSLAYALLVKDFSLAIATCGLDPLLGFYHQPKFGRVSLALDLMEEFRSVIADSVVVSVVNNNLISEGDFIRSAGAVSLTSAARRALIQAHERRMDALVTHPLFGYKVSYRRVLEIQARLLTRVILGEVSDYPSFLVR